MPRVLILECMQEISSFNPVASSYDDFAIQCGKQLMAQANSNTAVGGAIAEFEQAGDIEIVPVISARAGSAGPLASASWDRLAEEILAAVKAVQGPIDGIYFSMHGAMGAENELDPEGALLEGVRRIIGNDVPIVISLDLHGILTGRMLENITAVVAYHTYPHVDFADTGRRAARLLIDTIIGDTKPTMVRVQIPALVRGDELLTATGCYGDMITELEQLEKSGTVLAAALLIGNPFTDVPELCSQVLIVIDGNPDVAVSEANRIAVIFWQNRSRMQAALISLDNAITQTRSMKGPVIYTDAADATSSGASGDSADILDALIKANYRGSVLAPVVDKKAAEDAHNAGVGATINVTLGGSLDHRFKQILLTATVDMLSDGISKLETSGHTLDAGPSAILISDNLTILVMSRSVSLFDRAMFFTHNRDPKQFDLTIVKSPYCEYHMFDEWSERNFNVDAPGSTSAYIPTLGHQNCGRPMYPIDQNLEFNPQPQIYRHEMVGSL